ncbi:MAG: glycosyltransferase family 2 protein [Pseudomonadota bacterium]|uniref:glycosyltransferase family 2 protein n=1 Tax=Tabrizicola sp. TaxID=2005166 RepID=UPI0025ED9705|nr:glycosyltransferase family 2 protein [Tabrizicola sp.]
MICSIIIPTKDRPKSLLAAVKSALNALPDGGEIVVVDDAGSIPAVEALSGFMSEKIKVLNNPGPHGPSQARNFGISQSGGEVLFFLDDDDELMPDYCKRVLNSARPAQCAYGHCAPLHMELDGQPTYHGRKQATGIYGDGSELHLRLAGMGMGFWIRRDAFIQSGGIDARIRVNEDTEFCIRLASMGLESYYDREPGVLLRHDPTRAEGDKASITKSANALERARGFEYILSKHSEFLIAHPKFRRLFLSRVVKYRSRAMAMDGFDEFSRTVRPVSDRLLMSSLGRAFIACSISVRSRRQIAIQE